MREDGPFRWWEDPEMEDMPEGNEASTRPADHPDGFSFLLAHPDPFWQTWLAFSALELARLRFLRWRYRSGQLSEWPATEKLAA
ncbi:MAG TPA: hypothetical protein VI789_05590 [Dehalococcoidia bacterium]|nr:hypothetical protein [Dehalococcoidia bacterium]